MSLYTDEVKLTEAKVPYRRKCQCGHVLTITNKYHRKICKWCGRMVYLKQEDEEKEKFKEKLRRLLKNE